MTDKPSRGRGPGNKYGAKTIVKSVRMPHTLWGDLVNLSERDGISMNEIVVKTLMRKVARELK